MVTDLVGTRSCCLLLPRAGGQGRIDLCNLIMMNVHCALSLVLKIMRPRLLVCRVGATPPVFRHKILFLFLILFEREADIASPPLALGGSSCRFDSISAATPLHLVSASMRISTGCYVGLNGRLIV